MLKQRIGWSLLVWSLFMAAVPGFALAQGSCLVNTAAANDLGGAKIEPADQRMSVVRPCAGRVKAGIVEVIFSTGAGFSQRAKVQAGEFIEARVREMAGARPLVDIWPRHALLTAVLDLAAGRRSTLSGVSGFEGDSKTVELRGDMLPIAGTRIRLGLHGWNGAAPVRVAQGGWQLDVAPVQGLLALPVERLRPGPFRLNQGSRTATLTVLAGKDAAQVMNSLRSIEQQGGDAQTLAMQRALLFQGEDLRINALSELTRGS